MVNMVSVRDRRNVCPKEISFLQKHVLKQRTRAKKETSTVKNESPSSRPIPSTSSPSRESEQKPVTEKVDQCDRSRDVAKETPEDIAKQIKDLKMKLESLKEKKHSLFQQLKAVLHEEDEKKRLREEEHKDVLEKSAVMDPRLSQAPLGIKRPLPLSPPLVNPGNQSTPAKKSHRMPLLPTPDAAGSGATVAPFVRQGSGGSFHPPVSEPYHGGVVRQHYGGQVPFQTGHRPHLEQQRFNQMPQELHTQGVPLVPYQYPQPAAPMPFNNISQSSPMTYQPVVQQGFVQPHLPEMPIQGQPHPHMFGRPHPQVDLKWQQGPAHYLPQGGPMPGNQPYPDHQHTSAGYAPHIQDPRHQKLVHEHQRSSFVLSSPNSLQSPPVQEMQPNIMNSPSSPGHTTLRDWAKK